MTIKELFEKAKAKGAEDFELAFTFMRVDGEEGWGVSVDHFKVGEIDIGFSSKSVSVSLEEV